MSEFTVIVNGITYKGYVKHSWTLYEREAYKQGFVAGIKAAKQ